MVGTVRLELMTSCMSSMRSNQLSYAPARLTTIPFSNRFVNKKCAHSEFFAQEFALHAAAGAGWAALFFPRARTGARAGKSGKKPKQQIYCFLE